MPDLNPNRLLDQLRRARKLAIAELTVASYEPPYTPEGGGGVGGAGGSPVRLCRIREFDARMQLAIAEPMLATTMPFHRGQAVVEDTEVEAFPNVWDAGSYATYFDTAVQLLVWTGPEQDPRVGDVCLVFDLTNRPTYTFYEQKAGAPEFNFGTYEGGLSLAQMKTELNGEGAVGSGEVFDWFVSAERTLDATDVIVLVATDLEWRIDDAAGAARYVLVAEGGTINVYEAEGSSYPLYVALLMVPEMTLMPRPGYDEAAPGVDGFMAGIPCDPQLAVPDTAQCFEGDEGDECGECPDAGSDDQCWFPGEDLSEWDGT